MRQRELTNTIFPVVSGRHGQQLMGQGDWCSQVRIHQDRVCSPRAVPQLDHRTDASVVDQHVDVGNVIRRHPSLDRDGGIWLCQVNLTVACRQEELWIEFLVSVAAQAESHEHLVRGTVVRARSPGRSSRL